MPKNTFKRVFFQNIFPLRGQQGGDLAVPPPPPSTSYPRKLPQNQKLPQKFLSAPEKKSYVKPWVNSKPITFMQDGAPPHWRTEVLDWLASKFGNNIISYKTARPYGHQSHQT